MRSRSSIEIRRCRPLLGTFVEIAACGGDEGSLARGIDAIARVNRLMSFHDPLSDVSRMNREAFPKGVSVHPWTWQVMRAAKRFAEESHGTFDITIAPLLTKWNYLPDRANGSVFLSAFAILTITGYGLYYAGGERLRAWMSWIHLGVGLALPILLLVHIFLGRRTRHSKQSRTRARLESLGDEDQHPKSIPTSPHTALNQGNEIAEFQVAQRRVL
jgi:hypothetical protein